MESIKGECIGLKETKLNLVDRYIFWPRTVAPSGSYIECTDWECCACLLSATIGEMRLLNWNLDEEGYRFVEEVVIPHGLCEG